MRLKKWTNESCFRFSKTKNKRMHLCQKRRLHNLALRFEEIEISLVDQHKLWGVILDKKLALIPQIRKMVFGSFASA